MKKTELNVIHELCGDEWGKTSDYATRITPHFGEPYFIKNYWDPSTNKTYNVLAIGDEYSSIDSLIADDKCFISGHAAGYVLPKASSYTLGGIINPLRGLNYNSDGETWVDVRPLAGTNLKYKSKDVFYEGFGTLNVDLSEYVGPVTIKGPLVADELLSTPVITGNVLRLREPQPDGEGEIKLPTELANDEYCGIELQYVFKKGANSFEHAFLGVNNKSELVFNNHVNDYRIPLVVASSLKKTPIIGINSNGIITEAAIQPITIKQRNNPKETTWNTTTLNIDADIPQTLELTIPKRLSDLEDYVGDDKDTANYVSGADRELWKNIITNVSTSSSYTYPTLQTTTYTVDGATFDTKKLIIPNLSVQVGKGLVNEGGKIDLPKINVTTTEDSWTDLTSITYIRNIEVDEYGRVTKIEKYKVNFN